MMSSILSRSHLSKGLCFGWKYHINYISPCWDMKLQLKEVVLCLLQRGHLLHLSFLMLLINVSCFPLLGQVLEALTKAIMNLKSPRFALF